MSNKLKTLMKAAQSWPEEDQEELAEYAREIQARRQGVYKMTQEERAVVEEGLEQVRRGEFVPDEDMRAF